MSNAKRLDWVGMMQLGLNELGMSATDFWALTPFELSVKAGVAGQANQSLNRQELNALCAQFPDLKKVK